MTALDTIDGNEAVASVANRLSEVIEHLVERRRASVACAAAISAVR